MNHPETLLPSAINAAIEAGIAIREVNSLADIGLELKEDQSPLTLADRRSHALIARHLEKFPWPLLSEEGASIPYEVRKNWTRFWMVDPLDGTKEFLKKNGEYTVNIALIESKIPVLGVIFVPATGQLFFGTREGGAYQLDIPENQNNLSPDWFENAKPMRPTRVAGPLRFVASRSHLSPPTLEYIETFCPNPEDREMVSVGSSLKFCLVAGGAADIYPRFGPTMEWDTAAGQAIAQAAGCKITRTDEQSPMEYNKPDLLNPWFIVKGPAIG